MEIYEAEVKEKDDLIQNLRNEKDQLQSKCESFEHSWRNTDTKIDNTIVMNIECREKELFPREISTYLEGLLWQAFETSIIHTKSTRKKDVLKSLISENKGFNLKKLGKRKFI